MAIIGAGVAGASVAYILSKYNIKTVILEKEADVSFGVSKANSGIIHAGFHHKYNTLKAKLELMGNLYYTQLHKELQFPFKRCGAVVAAFTEEDMSVINELYENGQKNEVPGLELCNRERILEMEPNINPDIIGGLYSPTTGIIEPYEMVFSLIETAVKNNTELLTEFKVVSVKKKNGLYTLISEKDDSISAVYVINAAGLYADEISRIFNAEKYTIEPRKGQEYILDKEAGRIIQRVIYPVPQGKTKGTLVMPTVEGTVMVGPTAEEQLDKTDVRTDHEYLKTIFDSARRLIPKISERYIITAFAGNRPVLKNNDDFYIKSSEKTGNFIHVAGIQSPGLTAAPAIGEYVKDLLVSMGLVLQIKTEWSPAKRESVKIRHLDNTILSQNYGQGSAATRIICRCENISEAEIREAIHNGHISLDGIKFYTRAGMGRCQGGFCQFRIMEIIARELNIPMTQITKRGFKSFILKKRIGEM